MEMVRGELSRGIRGDCACLGEYSHQSRTAIALHQLHLRLLARRADIRKLPELKADIVG